MINDKLKESINKSYGNMRKERRKRIPDKQKCYLCKSKIKHGSVKKHKNKYYCEICRDIVRNEE